MCRMSTMPCMLTSTGTTSHSGDLPSIFFKTFGTIFCIFYTMSSMMILYREFDVDCFVACRFFKESSEEERGHAEKLMEYQVCGLVCFLI